MFCYLENIELSINHCPVPCIYRNQNSQCSYQALTPDTDENDTEASVTVQTISDVKGIKLYKAKAETATAKLQIKIGLAILRYSDYIKRQKVVEVSTEIREFIAMRTEGKLNNDSGIELEKIQELLLYVFGLGFEHQIMFFDPSVFKAWKATLPQGSSATSDSLALPLFIEALQIVAARSSSSPSNPVKKT